MGAVSINETVNVTNGIGPTAFPLIPSENSTNISSLNYPSEENPIENNESPPKAAQQTGSDALNNTSPEKESPVNETTPLQGNQEPPLIEEGLIVNEAFPTETSGENKTPPSKEPPAQDEDERLLNASQSEINESNSTQIQNTDVVESARTKSFLATIFNEEKLSFDAKRRSDYLNAHNNFSSLQFHRVDLENTFTFTVGAKRDTLRGISANENRFAVDLVDCDAYHQYCVFLVNGIPTKKLFNEDSFNLDGEHVLTISSAELNKCDNRFCHLGYEGYHEVDVVIEKRGVLR